MTLMNLETRRGLRDLTISKTIINAAIRWPATFLPVLSQAFGASTATLTSIMGAAELSGLATSVTGSVNDRGHERKVITAATLLVAASALLSLIGNTTSFAAGYVLLVIGLSHATVAAHAWISHRVSFANRGRALGTFESSWAFGLLLGAPIIAGLIAISGWRAVYIALAIGSTAGAALVWFRVPRSGHASTDRSPAAAPIPSSAWPPMLASAATAFSGIGLFVIAGTWLADEHGMSTTQLGIIAACYGGVELISTSMVATLADRMGPRRAVFIGLAIEVVAIITMAVAGGSTPVAIGGVIGFLAGFEYAFISSLALVSEAAPESRGKAIGISNAFGTIARSSTVVIAGYLYERFSIAGPLTSATIAAAVAVGLLMIAKPPSRRTPAPARPPRRGVYLGQSGGPPESPGMSQT